MASFELISLVPTWKHLLKSPKKSVQWKTCLQHLKHFFPCLLISVDKNPGFPLMGVGEILHCIVEKAVVSSLGESIVSFLLLYKFEKAKKETVNQSYKQCMQFMTIREQLLFCLQMLQICLIQPTWMSSYPMLHYFDIVILLIIDF